MITMAGIIAGVLLTFKTTALFGYQVNHFRDEVKARAYATLQIATYTAGFISISLFLILNNSDTSEAFGISTENEYLFGT